MNPNFSNIKKVFNAYTLYVVLAIVVFGNIFLFPNLLNHKDIKLNDLSYLLNKEVEVLAAPFINQDEFVNTLFSDEQKVMDVEEKKENDGGIRGVDYINSEKVEEKAEGKGNESDSQSDQATIAIENIGQKETLTILEENTGETSEEKQETEEVVDENINVAEKSQVYNNERNADENLTDNVAIMENNNVDSMVNKESNAEMSSEESTPITNADTAINTIAAVDTLIDPVEENKTTSNETASDETITNINQENIPVEEIAITSNETRSEEINTNINQENIVTTENSGEEKGKTEDNPAFLRAVPEVNENTEEKQTEIISSDITTSNSENSNENVEETQEKKKAAHPYYLLILFIVLSSFIAGLVIFINKNYETFRQIYETSKSTYKIRHYLYSGYELLED